eukprot:gene8685-10308_t
MTFRVYVYLPLHASAPGFFIVMASPYDLRSQRQLVVDIKDIRLTVEPVPTARAEGETVYAAAIRTMRYELEDRVAELYDGDKGKAIAKEIRTDVLGGKNARVRARESNKARIGDVIWRLRREFEKHYERCDGVEELR